MKRRCRNQIRDIDAEVYCESIPLLQRPRNDLTFPVYRDEQVYCWFFWFHIIQKDPRWVLDNLHQLPTFKAPWSSKRKDFKKLLLTRKEKQNVAAPFIKVLKIPPLEPKAL